MISKEIIRKKLDDIVQELQENNFDEAILVGFFNGLQFGIDMMKDKESFEIDYNILDKIQKKSSP